MIEIIYARFVFVIFFLFLRLQILVSNVIYFYFFEFIFQSLANYTSESKARISIQLNVVNLLNVFFDKKRQNIIVPVGNPSLLDYLVKNPSNTPEIR